MRWYVSYPILAAGLAFGFDTFFPGEPGLSQPSKREIQREARVSETAPVVILASEIAALPTSRLAAFSPGPRLLAAEAPPPAGSVLGYLARTFAPREPAAPAAAAAVPVTVAAWKSAIVQDWEPAVVPATQARTPEPTSRLALTRDVQRELQRVGCYLGAIDGVWGGGSKRAVLAFMDRVNATLPTREPDVFMLSLLRSQTSEVCDSSCPRGQSATAGGRCVPSTLIAQAGEETAPERASDAPPPVAVADAATERRPLPYGRMGIGGPKPEDVGQVSSGWSTLTGDPPRAAPLERTAALDMVADDDARGRAGVAAPSSFDSDAGALPVRRSKRAASAPKVRTRQAPPPRQRAYRHVQNLFQHPLGRM